MDSVVSLGRSSVTQRPTSLRRRVETS